LGSYGRAKLKDILGMLKECAPGAQVTPKKHHYWVSWNGQTFRQMGLGEHGTKTPEIEIGVIKHMIRQLGIDADCAQRHLPILRGRI